MANRLITLTTDFGLSDHFVGAMKGVIAGIAPAARVVDISHEIAPYNVTEAAFVIAEAWPYFPKGTIHVVVVDPGVGSARRPILAEAGGHFFIAPDNGVLSMVFDARSAQGPRDLESEVHAPRNQPHVSRPRRVRSRRRASGEGREARGVRQADPRLCPHLESRSPSETAKTPGAATILKVGSLRQSDHELRSSTSLPASTPVRSKCAPATQRIHGWR